MSSFSKIVLLILVILSFFFIKDKTGFETGFDINKIFHKTGIQINENTKNEEMVKPPEEIIKQKEEPAQEAVIYFLALDSNDNGIYKKVMRSAPSSGSILNFALKELLKGPDLIEKASGAYSEIPAETKLLSLKETENKIIINLSSDFQDGGGTDSIYSRMMQLIKTSSANASGKKVYLQLDGKQIKFIGGEGIMVTQPLSEKSLEI